jgi:uncharacterized LabA/DUF88 family protein
MKFKVEPFKLELKGKTAVFIDWANVYRWRDSLKADIDLKKLFDYLRSYSQIKELSFYFGTDNHPSSKEQIKQAWRIGFRTVTKPVKYLPRKIDEGKIIWERKCDFDLEIGLDCFERMDNFEGFIFFSGDGDFATLYERLIKRKKQVIVVYMYGHLGREVWDLKKGIFKASIKKFKTDFYKKMTPRRRQGAQLAGSLA